MRKSIVLAGICAAMISGVGAAQAGTTTETFANPIVTSSTAGPGVWYTDRYAPAGFATSGGVLVESIAAADQQANSFLNTQGRAFDLGAGVTTLSIDLYIDRTFTQLDQRIAGLWGVGTDGTDVTAYPIVELKSVAGHLEFQGFNTAVGGFTDLASADALIGTWQTLTISLNTATDLFTYSAGGGTGTAAGNGSTSIQSVILQGYNNGASFNAQWDNLAQTTAGVPEPGSWALMILGFGGVGAAVRRRQLRLAA